MKSLLALIGILALSQFATANDGGIAAIKVDQIKMRKIQFNDGKQIILERIAQPSHQITFEGGEAKKLMQVLPGAMQAGIRNYSQHFKSLGIYSKGSAEASSKVIDISCSDADVNDDFKVVPAGKTSCTITIEAANSEYVEDSFGDMMTFEPKTCK